MNILSSLYIWAVQPLQPPLKNPHNQPVLESTAQVADMPLPARHHGSPIKVGSPPQPNSPGLLQPLLTLQGKAWSLPAIFFGATMPQKMPIWPQSKWKHQNKVAETRLFGFIYTWFEANMIIVKHSIDTMLGFVYNIYQDTQMLPGILLAVKVKYFSNKTSARKLVLTCPNFWHNNPIETLGPVRVNGQQS